MQGISGVTGDRRLVIDNAHRYPAATQAPDDSETLVVASEDHSTDPV
jgi:hypothetical protein